MKKEHFLLLVVGVVIVVAIFLRLNQLGKNVSEPTAQNNVSEPINQGSAALEDGKQESINENETVVPPASEESRDVDGNIVSEREVFLFSPGNEELVTSPLIVEGLARGSWFFEAELSVKLYAEGGELIVDHFGQAQTEEWMTKDFVPFISTLEFQTNAEKGYLVIAKNNPTGLPEHDAQYTFPVRFK